MAQPGHWNLQIVKRSDQTTGFSRPAQTIVVERTFAWLGRNRRLAKDFETSTASASAWILIASIRLMLTRLATV